MKILNLGIVAHVDAGKTTLTEQIMFKSGLLRKIGSVDDGTAQTDFLEVERERGISVRASSATLKWGETIINIIDTPGHVDFAAEVERSMMALDAAVIVISAVEGIQPQTELLYEALKKTETNIIIFINKIDRVGSNAAKVIEDVKSKFCENVICFTEIADEGEKTCKSNPLTLDDTQLKDEIIDIITKFDESILEEYLLGELNTGKIDAGLSRQMSDGNVLPVLCGSAFFGVGIEPLLDFIVKYYRQIKNNNDDALSGIVYKITHDRTMGKLAHVRMFGGCVRNRDLIKLSSDIEPQKVTQIRKYSGQKYTDTGEVSRGDIAVLCGLANAKVSDVIGEVENIMKCSLSVPLLKVKVIPEDNCDPHKLIEIMEELSDEDPQLDMEYNPDEDEINISITGTIQLEILEALIRQRFNTKVSFSAPTVIYKETPEVTGRGFEAYTMPKPCWAVIDLLIEPAARGSGLEYKSVVSNNQILYRYQNHIETAVPRALKQGLYNWEVTDLKVTLVGGEHHNIHTHPLDFFLATPMAVMNGLKNTGTNLLEPVNLVKIIAPEDCSGKIIGDIIRMRGEYDSPVISAGNFTIEAKLPVSESIDYPVRLAAISSGKAVMSTRFSGYQVCPLELGAVAKRKGVNPLDREKWILNHRNALTV